MKINLPNSAFLGNIDPFLRSIDTTNENILEITSNPRWIAIHPVVLSITAALGLELRARGAEVVCHKMEAKSRHYLERMRLFRFLGIESGISVSEHEPAGRFIPLTQIKDSEQLESFISEMVPLLHTEPSRVGPIKYVVSELVRNVLEHSLSAHGAIVCAQFYPKTNTIRIGVADTGIGIKKTITASHRAADDMEAIKLALTPGITGTTPSKLSGTESNAGAGLFFIRAIARANRDFFVLYSGNSMYKLLRTPRSKQPRLFADPFTEEHSKDGNLAYWRGTAVGIDISLDRHQEFDKLLDLIRDVYRKERVRPSGTRLKRPRFI